MNACVLPSLFDADDLRERLLTADHFTVLLKEEDCVFPTESAWSTPSLETLQADSPATVTDNERASPVVEEPAPAAEEPSASVTLSLAIDDAPTDAPTAAPASFVHVPTRTSPMLTDDAAMSVAMRLFSEHDEGEKVPLSHPFSDPLGPITVRATTTALAPVHPWTLSSPRTKEAVGTPCLLHMDALATHIYAMPEGASMTTTRRITSMRKLFSMYLQRLMTPRADGAYASYQKIVMRSRRVLEPYRYGTRETLNMPFGDAMMQGQLFFSAVPHPSPAEAFVLVRHPFMRATVDFDELPTGVLSAVFRTSNLHICAVRSLDKKKILFGVIDCRNRVWFPRHNPSDITEVEFKEIYCEGNVRVFPELRDGEIVQVPHPEFPLRDARARKHKKPKSQKEKRERDADRKRRKKIGIVQ